MSKRLVLALIELCGLAAIVTGIAFIYWPAAAIVGGGLLVFAANVKAD